MGLAGVAACVAMAVVTQRDATPPEDRAWAGSASSNRSSDGKSVRDADSLLTDAIPARDSSDATRQPVSSRPHRTIRLRVVSDGVGASGAIVRAVTLDKGNRTALALSDVRHVGSDGIVDLSVADGGDDVCWLEIASATTRGLRHGYRPLPTNTSADEIEVSLPLAGRLEVRVEGLPPALMPKYLDIRFLTPEGGWEELFSELVATPLEDGGLFESRAIPRVERMRLRPNGTGELPEVPDDHALYVEFPSTPEGWLVERTEFSGKSVTANSGEVCRVKAGATGVYQVKFRRAPSVRVRVEDAAGHPLANAQVHCGLRHPKGEGRARLFETGAVTDAKGMADVPLWTGSRLPEWSPQGLVVTASADGHCAHVLETNGGWYGQEAVLRLDAARDGTFTLEGTLKHANGRIAPGIPVKVAAAAPWNGDAAFPSIRGVSDGDGRYRLAVPESYRTILEYGGLMRVAVDSERLDTQSQSALWRSLYPNLMRATTVPESFKVPAPRTHSRHDLVLDIPPP